MKSLFWLSFRRNEKFFGVVIIEARELLEARMLAAIDGLDECAEFAEGYELSAQQAAMILGPVTGPDASASRGWPSHCMDQKRGGEKEYTRKSTASRVHRSSRHRILNVRRIVAL